MYLKYVANGLVAFTLFASGVAAQGVPNAASISTKPESEDEKAKPIGFTNGGFVVAPIPIKNPTIGTGLALGGGYLFTMDEESNNSYLGLAGFKTDNGSQGYGISGDIAWDSNRWNLGMTIGKLDLFYNYFLAGSDGPIIPLKQSGSLVDLTLKYGFTNEILLGVKAAYIETNVGLDAAGVLPPELIPDADLAIWKLGPTFEFDSRDNTFYPTSGSHFSFVSTYNQVESAFGSGEYVKTVATYDAFTNLTPNLVVAARAAACSVTEETPFFEQCGLGSVDNFRGFAFGEVLDESLISFQAELRGQATKRIGYVLFAGLGNVASDFSEFSQDSIRTSAGVGLRFRLSEKFPMDFSLDAARADNGQDSYYIYVGQRF